MGGILVFLILNFLATSFARPSNQDPELISSAYGDIISSSPDGTLPPPSIFNAIQDKSFLWKVENGNEEDNVLYYDINEDEFDSEQLFLIDEGIQDLQNSVMVGRELCVELRRIDRDAPDVPAVWVRVLKGGGCSSLLGRRLPAQPLSLADGCVSRHGTIMHEFLHALGFYHEHMRGDRDDYVYVNFTNIEPGLESNFEKLEENVTIDHLGTPYDYGSVMHYPNDGFAVDPDYDTITPVPDPGVEIGQRLELSELDIERVQILYGCLAPEDSKHFQAWTEEDIFTPGAWQR